MQSGKYRGQKFCWLLENCPGYVGWFVGSILEDRVKGDKSSVTQMANKDSLLVILIIILKIITNVMYSVLIYITMKFYEKVPEFILVLTLCRCIVPCLRSLGPLLPKNYLVGARKFKMNGRDFVRKGMLYLGNNFICFFLEESCPQKRFGEKSEGLQLPNE